MSVRSLLRKVSFHNDCTLKWNLNEFTIINRSKILLKLERIEVKCESLCINSKVQNKAFCYINSLTIFLLGVNDNRYLIPLSSEINICIRIVVHIRRTSVILMALSLCSNSLACLHLHGNCNLLTCEIFWNCEEDLACPFLSRISHCLHFCISIAFCIIYVRSSREFIRLAILIFYSRILSYNNIVVIPVIHTLDILERDVVETVSDWLGVVREVKREVGHLIIQNGDLLLNLSPFTDLDGDRTCLVADWHPASTVIGLVEATAGLNFGLLKC